jgi:hypothetical protein
MIYELKRERKNKENIRLQPEVVHEIQRLDLDLTKGRRNVTEHNPNI